MRGCLKCRLRIQIIDRQVNSGLLKWLRNMRRLVDLVAVIIIVVLGLSFAMLNTDVTHLNYYFGSIRVPLSLLLIAILFVGAVLGALSTAGILLRQRAEIVRLRRRSRMEHKVLSERGKLSLGGTSS